MKNSLIFGVVVVMLLIILGVYLYSNSNNDKTYKYSGITYDDCVADVLKEIRILGPASEEPIGATRKDREGNVWVKVAEEIWETDAEKYNKFGIKTAWGDYLIDEQPGGVKDTLGSFPQCEKYLSTRNAEMEEGLRKIVNAEIENQKQKDILISIEELRVLNLAGKSQAFIKLKCNKDLSSASEEEIIKNIANKLFQEYPDEYSENSKSGVDINCKYKMGWGISNGQYGPRI